MSETCHLHARARHLFLVFISPLSFLFFFFLPRSCQAVTAAEKGQGGMDSAVSVAHNLHLIGAWLMDGGPGVSQRQPGSEARRHARGRVHRTVTSPWQRGLNERSAQSVFVSRAPIPTFLPVEFWKCTH